MFHHDPVVHKDLTDVYMRMHQSDIYRLEAPVYKASRTYTHRDTHGKDGILWRMSGGRPVSELADFAQDMLAADIDRPLEELPWDP